MTSQADILSLPRREFSPPPAAIAMANLLAFNTVKNFDINTLEYLFCFFSRGYLVAFLYFI
jgi:hypothetical protein